jgi:large subunit ribosomal protein L25
MEKVVLKAKKRTEFSKSYLTKLRNSGSVPGVFYLRTTDPIAIEVPENSINQFVFTSETHLIDLKLDDGSEFECILKDTQFDPVTDKVIHFDLLGIIRGEKIQLEVPVLFTGNPVGVREGGVLNELVHKLEIECLPRNIPENVTIDISNLKIGDSIQVKDVTLENFEILNAPESVIVSIASPKGAKDSEDVSAAEIKEPEVISKGKEKEE